MPLRADGALGDAVQLTDAAETYRPGRYVRYLEDARVTMTAADAVGVVGWNRSERTTRNFGFTSAVYWLSLPLQNQTADPEWYVQVAYPLVVAVLYRGRHVLVSGVQP